MAGFSSIDGISSGLDTTAIVDAIMQYERRNAVLLEVQQAEKQAVITAYQALQAKFLALSSQLSQLTKASTFEKASVNVSNTSVLTATNRSRVGTGAYDVQVLSLARNHQIASQGFDDDSLASFGTGEITIAVGDASEQTITIDASNNSLVGIKQAINDARVGVTVSIINDGSSSQPYRLILSADKTGVANDITITSDLTGGSNLNFSTSSFDNPETVSMDADSTSQISLGPTAAYTGSENKIYTFTVAGEGSQIIGTDNITINWDDGANSGSIVVTQADFEYELVGDGADGLKLTFSSGTLNAGDVFQVTSFAPQLQAATDAKITVGSSGGSGSPIIITSQTNTFREAIGGLELTVRTETAAGESVTITTGIDTTTIKDSIGTFIDRFNEITKYIDEQNTYTEDSEGAPPLFGDYTIWTLQSSLRSRLGSGIPGIESNFNQLYSIGIRTGSDGKLAIKDTSRLENALRNNLDDVIRLFTNSGSSSANGIQFISVTSNTKAGATYDVDISQAATHGGFEGGDIDDPASTAITLDSTNNRLKLNVDGLVSDEIVLTEKSYQSASELVNEIQSRIDNDSKIGGRGLTVEWVETEAGKGHLNFASSAYGSTSKVEINTSIGNSAYSSLGLATGSTYAGKDVEGTINGEEAGGIGQVLTGKEGNANTDGLKVKITLDESQVVSGPEGSIAVTRGVAARLSDLVGSLIKAGDGTFDRRIASYENQIEFLGERVEDIDERLAKRRESLLKKFYNMEVALGQFSATSQFLNNQLAGINMNWKGYQSQQ